MVTFVVSCKARAGKEAEAEEAIRELVACVDKDEPGASAYVFHRNIQDRSEMVLFKCYDDDAAFAQHNGSAHMALFRSRFQDLFDSTTTQMWPLERIEGVVRPSPALV